MTNHATAAFLRAVTPTTGRLCFWRSNPARHAWFTQADQATRAADAAGVSDVYFALGSFTTASRKARDCQALRALWLDVDAGPGKPFATVSAAAQGLAEFVADSGMPEATHLVASGGGLHVYWALDADLARDAWLPYAEGLKRLCVQHGFAVGPERTTDAASILRVPGTVNGKHADNPRAVRLLVAGEAVTTAQLAGLLLVPRPAHPATRAVTALGAPPDALVMPRTMPEREYAPRRFAHYIDQADVTKRCVQLDVTLATRGRRDAEPLWRAALSVVHACAGDSAEEREAHYAAVSDGHPGFDRDATIAKAAGTVGPMSCDQFDAQRPGACDGCPHKGVIVSPVQLAWAPRLPNMVHVDAPPRSPGALPTAPASATLLIPDGYFVRSGCLHRHIPESARTEKNPDESEFICATVFGAIAYNQGEIDGGYVDEVVWQSLPSGQPTRQVGFALADLNKPTGKADLLSQLGLVQPAQEGMRQRLARYIVDVQQAAQRLLPRLPVHTRFGWHADGTINMPGVQVLPGGGTSPCAIFSPGRKREDLTRHRAGTLTGWTGFLQDFYAREHPLRQFVLMAGFAAPLYAAVPGMVGGLISLYSADSGTGKTALSSTVAAIYGRPDDLIVARGSTVKGMILRMAHAHSLPLSLDEVTTMDDAAIGDILYSLTQGKERSASTRDGRLRDGGKEWRAFALSSSNFSVLEKCRRLKGLDGTNALHERVLEIQMPPLLGGAAAAVGFGEQLQQNYGWAGEAWLQHLQRNKAAMLAEVAAKREALMTRLGLSTSARFRVGIVASALVAASHTARLGLHSFDLDRIEAAIVGALTAAATDSAAERVTPADMLAEALAELKPRTVVYNGETNDRFRADTVLEACARVDYRAGFIYISSKALRSTIKGDLRAVTAFLRESGAKEHRYRLLSKLTDKTTAPTRCVVIDMTSPLGRELVEHHGVGDVLT